MLLGEKRAAFGHPLVARAQLSAEGETDRGEDDGAYRTVAKMRISKSAYGRSETTGNKLIAATVLAPPSVF